MKDLDYQALAARIGSIVLRLPLIARHLGHDQPLSTLDYIRPSEADDEEFRAAVEFLRDLLDEDERKPTTEMVSKWFGPESAFEFNVTDMLARKKGR